MSFIELIKGNKKCEDIGSFSDNLLCRVVFIWAYKAILSISSIFIFFLFYFYFLKHNFFEMTIIPETYIDELIPFEPYFFYIYVSLWIYLSLSLAIIKNKNELKNYLYSLTILGASAILFLSLFPNNHHTT